MNNIFKNKFGILNKRALQTKQLETSINYYLSKKKAENEEVEIEENDSKSPLASVAQFQKHWEKQLLLNSKSQLDNYLGVDENSISETSTITTEYNSEQDDVSRLGTQLKQRPKNVNISTTQSFPNIHLGNFEGRDTSQNIMKKTNDK